MDLNEFWLGMLGAAGAAAVGWFSGAFGWAWGKVCSGRKARRDRRDLFDTMLADFPKTRDMVSGVVDSVGRITGEIRTIQGRLTAQDEVLADTLAITQAQFEMSAPGFICDADGRNLHVNAAYAHLVGVGRDEMLGLKWQRVVHPDDLAPHMRRFEQARIGHYDFDDEIRIKAAVGGWIPVKVHMLPHPRDVGPAVRWVGTVKPL